VTVAPVLWPVVGPALVGVMVAVTTWRRSTNGPATRRRKPSGFVVAAGAAVVTVVGWWARMPIVAVVGPLLTVMAMAERNRRTRTAASIEVDEQLPAFVDAMIQRLRSGMGLHGVCLDPPLIGTRVDAMAESMVAALTDGLPLADSASRFGSANRGEGPTLGGEGPNLVATALGVLTTQGGPAIPALQRLRLTLTSLAQGRAEARARASQALASARLLIAAPALFAVLLASFDDDLAHVYLREPLGAVCVGSCVALSYLGWRWMNRLVAGALPLSDLDGSDR
jgi:Flp pilus assembly protein TadB